MASGCNLKMSPTRQPLSLKDAVKEGDSAFDKKTIQEKAIKELFPPNAEVPSLNELNTMWVKDKGSFEGYAHHLADSLLKGKNRAESCFLARELFNRVNEANNAEMKPLYLKLKEIFFSVSEQIKKTMGARPLLSLGLMNAVQISAPKFVDFFLREDAESKKRLFNSEEIMTSLTNAIPSKNVDVILLLLEFLVNHCKEQTDDETLNFTSKNDSYQLYTLAEELFSSSSPKLTPKVREKIYSLFVLPYFRKCDDLLVIKLFLEHPELTNVLAEKDLDRFREYFASSTKKKNSVGILSYASTDEKISEKFCVGAELSFHYDPEHISEIFDELSKPEHNIPKDFLLRLAQNLVVGLSNSSYNWAKLFLTYEYSPEKFFTEMEALKPGSLEINYLPEMVNAESTEELKNDYNFFEKSLCNVIKDLLNKYRAEPDNDYSYNDDVYDANTTVLHALIKIGDLKSLDWFVANHCFEINFEHFASAINAEHLEVFDYICKITWRCDFLDEKGNSPFYYTIREDIQSGRKLTQKLLRRLRKNYHKEHLDLLFKETKKFSDQSFPKMKELKKFVEEYEPEKSVHSSNYFNVGIDDELYYSDESI